MRWHQIDQALVALAFPAWISHAPSIVRNDDDVNGEPLNGLAKEMTTDMKRKKALKGL